MRKNSNAEIRKPEILEAYYKIIIKEGVEGASIGKVAKKLKIHPSLIIHYFGTKENMGVELVARFSKKYSKLFDRLRIETVDLEKRLNHLINIFWSDEWYSLTEVSGDFSILSVSFRNKKILSQLQALYLEFNKLIAKELKPMIEAGIVKIKDPSRAAEMIITIFEGYRHFMHFFIEADSVQSYKKEMVRSVLKILKMN